MISEIDEMIKRVESTHKSVAGVIVANTDGTIFRTTLNDKKETAQNYANIVAEIVDKARMALKDKDNVNDELNFLKIRTKKVEFIVVPDFQKDFILITILNISTESIA